jgi:transcriptional regulator with XRE-family HTH domain
MSPRRTNPEDSERVKTEIRRGALAFGQAIRDARLARRWSVRELATRAGISADMVYAIEAGKAGSAATNARLAVALGRHVALSLIDPRRRDNRPELSADPVHSAMGEIEARQLRRHGLPVGIDEPYQHFQFAGRADLIAWDLHKRAFLHIENRTRFPDFQEMAGAYNAKRAYLGRAVAQRLGIDRWNSETHVMAALWSGEVTHSLRLRTESFRSICPDGAQAFERWWNGEPHARGVSSVLIALDPRASGRQRVWVGIDDALTTRPRYRGYAEAATQIANGQGAR